MKRSYVVVTPARDEERTIAATIESMLRQTVRPLRWVIVNDGSTDRTRAVVEPYLAAHPWIELVERADRGHRALGGGVVEAFHDGFARVAGLSWDYVVKFDADQSFDVRYFEGLLERFEADPKLGIASGKTFLVENGRKSIEWCHDDHVRGSSKMYRRACFEAIGGLEARRGWDMIDETRAQMLGWTTRSFIEHELIHDRPMDARQSNVLRSRFEMGSLYWFLGYHWLYHAVRCARSAVQDFPIVLGGVALFAGYLWAALTRRPRYDADYVAFVQKSQLARFNWRHLRDFLQASGARSEP